MVLQLLRALAGAVLVAHRHRPDPAGHAADHGVLGVHAVGEEERQVGREVVDVHAAREVGLDVGEAVGQGEGELADGVRPGLGDVVAGDGDRVEVAHLLLDEPLLDVGHHPQRELGGEQAGVLALVLLEDVGLHRAAHAGHRVRGEHRGLVGVGLAALALAEGVDLLVDDGVEEEGQHRGRGAVDRHRDRGGRRDQVEAVVEHLHVVEGGHRDAGGADLAVDVGALVGVAAVEGHGVEGGREPLGLAVGGEDLEPAVGARGVALAGEHPRRVLAVALELEDAGGEGEEPGQVLAAPEAHQLARVVVRRQRDPGDLVAAERLAGQGGVDLLVAHHHDLLVAGVGLHHRGPRLELLGDLGVELAPGLLEQGRHVAGVVVLELGGDGLEALDPARRLGELLGALVVAAHGLGDLGQVAHPVLGHHGADAGGVLDLDGGQGALLGGQALLDQDAAQVLVERGDAVVVEGGGAGAEDRHLVGLLAERLAVAHQLAAHVAQRVLGAAALELVDGHGVGEVEHVDLLELAGGAELGRHHVHRGVDERHDRRVALADAGGLDDDQVEAGGLGDVDDVRQVVGQLVGAAGGQGAEEHPVAVEAVHPDPVAEQRPAALAPGRVDGDHGHAQLVLLVDAEAAHQLVGERGLAGPAGAGDAEHGGVAARGGLLDGLELAAEAAQLGAGDGAGHREPVAAEHLLGGDRAGLPQVVVAVGDHAVDHPDQAHPLPVLGREDGDPRVAQALDLVAHDHATTTAHDLDVPGAALAQRLHEVLEVLDVPALVRRHGDALHVLLERSVDDLGHGAVVPEVDHLAALALEDPPHDVDRRVVAVEQARGRDEADGVGGLVQVAHAGSLRGR